MKSGIYKIECVPSRKVYIGQSVNIKSRRWAHLSDLRNGNHCNRYLQRSFNKYGEKSFKWSIVGLYPVSLLDDFEKHWIDYYKCNQPNGFNSRGGGNSLHSHSMKTRLKMSKAQSNRSPETRRKLSEANKNPSPELRRLRSIIASNPSPETRRKMSEAAKNRSPKLKRKFMKMARELCSPEHRRKIGEGNRGKVRSLEIRRKLSIIHTGKPWSAIRRNRFEAKIKPNRKENLEKIINKQLSMKEGAELIGVSKRQVRVLLSKYHETKHNIQSILADPVETIRPQV